MSVLLVYSSAVHPLLSGLLPTYSKDISTITGMRGAAGGHKPAAAKTAFYTLNSTGVSHDIQQLRIIRYISSYRIQNLRSDRNPLMYWYLVPGTYRTR